MNLHNICMGGTKRVPKSRPHIYKKINMYHKLPKNAYYFPIIVLHFQPFPGHRLLQWTDIHISSMCIGFDCIAAHKPLQKTLVHHPIHCHIFRCLEI